MRQTTRTIKLPGGGGGVGSLGGGSGVGDSLNLKTLIKVCNQDVNQ